MSEREDVEALAGVIHNIPGVECSHVDDKQPSCERDAETVLASSWLAVHDELVRADERKRLAGEDDVLYRSERAAARDILRRAERLAGEVAEWTACGEGVPGCIGCEHERREGSKP